MKLIRKLVLLGSALSLVSTLPANAVVLQGNVHEETNAAPTPQLQIGAAQSSAAQPSAPLQYQQAIAAPQSLGQPPTAPRNVRYVSANEMAEARARALQGTWFCVTQVTDSSTPGVMPGTVVRCQVQYTRDEYGNLLERWTENGWTPSTAAVVKLNSAVITVSHVSASPSRGGTVIARSTDALKQVAPNTIIAQGLVNQYSNGQFIGQYKTTSVLRRAA